MGDPTLFDKIESWFWSSISNILPRKLIFHCAIRMWVESELKFEDVSDADWWEISFGDIVNNYL